MAYFTTVTLDDKISLLQDGLEDRISPLQDKVESLLDRIRQVDTTCSKLRKNAERERKQLKRYKWTHSRKRSTS